MNAVEALAALIALIGCGCCADRSKAEQLVPDADIEGIEEMSTDEEDQARITALAQVVRRQLTGSGT